MGSALRRTSLALAHPDAMQGIVRHISCGGTLRSYCNNLQLRYQDVIWWIQQNESRNEQYGRAKDMQKEWIKEDLVGTLATMAQTDIGDIVASDGTIKPANEWPEHIRRSMQSISVDIGRDGEIKTNVKLPDRLKALEMVGRAFGIWKDKIEVDGELSFSDAVMQAAMKAREAERGVTAQDDDGNPNGENE